MLRLLYLCLKVFKVYISSRSLYSREKCSFISKHCAGLMYKLSNYVLYHLLVFVCDARICLTSAAPRCAACLMALLSTCTRFCCELSHQLRLNFWFLIRNHLNACCTPLHHVWLLKWQSGFIRFFFMVLLLLFVCEKCEADKWNSFPFYFRYLFSIQFGESRRVSGDFRIGSSCTQCFTSIVQIIC